MSDDRPLILAIDGNPASLLALGAALAPEFELEVVSSGQAGFERALAVVPDLVLLEVGLADMEGLETCRLFKLEPRLAAIPLVFITSLEDSVDELSALELGAADYITQPFQIELVRMRIRNVLALGRLKRELRASEERLRLMLNASGEGLWEWQRGVDTLSLNPAACRLLGLEAGMHELPRAAFLQLVHARDRAAFEQALEACAAGTASYQCEYRLHHADGRYRWVRDRGQVVSRDSGGRAQRMVGSLIDIDERKRSEADRYRLAYFDLLTGLPNRRLLLDRLQQATIRNERSKRHGALLLIDVEQFRAFNAVHGHALGDALLIETGSRLQGCVREQDTVARVGDDEFVVMLEALSGEIEVAARDASRVGDKILHALGCQSRLGPLSVRCTSRIGLTLFGGTADDSEQVLQRAELALKEAGAATDHALKTILPVIVKLPRPPAD